MKTVLERSGFQSELLFGGIDAGLNKRLYYEVDRSADALFVYVSEELQSGWLHPAADPHALHIYR